MEKDPTSVPPVFGLLEKHWWDGHAFAVVPESQTAKKDSKQQQQQNSINTNNNSNNATSVAVVVPMVMKSFWEQQQKLKEKQQAEEEKRKREAELSPKNTTSHQEGGESVHNQHQQPKVVIDMDNNNPTLFGAKTESSNNLLSSPSFLQEEDSGTMSMYTAKKRRRSRAMSLAVLAAKGDKEASGKFAQLLSKKKSPPSLVCPQFPINKMDFLPRSALRINNLAVLDLSNSRLTDLGSGAAWRFIAKTLRVLYLHDNRITRYAFVESVLSELYNLQHLTLAGNFIEPPRRNAGRGSSSSSGATAGGGGGGGYSSLRQVIAQSFLHLLVLDEYFILDVERLDFVFMDNLLARKKKLEREKREEALKHQKENASPFTSTDNFNSLTKKRRDLKISIPGSADYRHDSSPSSSLSDIRSFYVPFSPHTHIGCERTSYQLRRSQVEERRRLVEYLSERKRQQQEQKQHGSRPGSSSAALISIMMSRPSTSTSNDPRPSSSFSATGRSSSLPPGISAEDSSSTSFTTGGPSSSSRNNNENQEQQQLLFDTYLSPNAAITPNTSFESLIAWEWKHLRFLPIRASALSPAALIQKNWRRYAAERKYREMKYRKTRLPSSSPLARRGSMMSLSAMSSSAFSPDDTEEMKQQKIEEIRSARKLKTERALAILSRVVLTYMHTRRGLKKMILRKITSGAENISIFSHNNNFGGLALATSSNYSDDAGQSNKKGSHNSSNKKYRLFIDQLQMFRWERWIDDMNSRDFVIASSAPPSNSNQKQKDETRKPSLSSPLEDSHRIFDDSGHQNDDDDDNIDPLLLARKKTKTVKHAKLLVGTEGAQSLKRKYLEYEGYIEDLKRRQQHQQQSGHGHQGGGVHEEDGVPERTQSNLSGYEEYNNERKRRSIVSIFSSITNDSSDAHSSSQHNHQQYQQQHQNSEEFNQSSFAATLGSSSNNNNNSFFSNNQSITNNSLVPFLMARILNNNNNSSNQNVIPQQHRQRRASVTFSSHDDAGSSQQSSPMQMLSPSASPGLQNMMMMQSREASNSLMSKFTKKRRNQILSLVEPWYASWPSWHTPASDRRDFDNWDLLRSVTTASYNPRKFLYRDSKLASFFSNTQNNDSITSPLFSANLDDLMPTGSGSGLLGGKNNASFWSLEDDTNSSKVSGDSSDDNEEDDDEEDNNEDDFKLDDRRDSDDHQATTIGGGATDFASLAANYQDSLQYQPPSSKKQQKSSTNKNSYNNKEKNVAHQKNKKRFSQDEMQNLMLQTAQIDLKQQRVIIQSRYQISITNTAPNLPTTKEEEQEQRRNENYFGSFFEKNNINNNSHKMNLMAKNNNSKKQKSSDANNNNNADDAHHHHRNSSIFSGMVISEARRKSLAEMMSSSTRVGAPLQSQVSAYQTYDSASPVLRSLRASFSTKERQEQFDRTRPRQFVSRLLRVKQRTFTPIPLQAVEFDTAENMAKFLLQVHSFNRLRPRSQIHFFFEDDLKKLRAATVLQAWWRGTWARLRFQSWQVLTMIEEQKIMLTTRRRYLIQQKSSSMSYRKNNNNNNQQEERQQGTNGYEDDDDEDIDYEAEMDKNSQLPRTPEDIIITTLPITRNLWNYKVARDLRVGPSIVHFTCIQIQNWWRCVLSRRRFKYLKTLHIVIDNHILKSSSRMYLSSKTLLVLLKEIHNVFYSPLAITNNNIADQDHMNINNTMMSSGVLSSPQSQNFMMINTNANNNRPPNLLTPTSTTFGSPAFRSPQTGNIFPNNTNTSNNNNINNNGPWFPNQQQNSSTQSQPESALFNNFSMVNNPFLHSVVTSGNSRTNSPQAGPISTQQQQVVSDAENDQQPNSNTMTNNNEHKILVPKLRRRTLANNNEGGSNRNNNSPPNVNNNVFSPPTVTLEPSTPFGSGPVVTTSSFENLQNTNNTSPSPLHDQTARSDDVVHNCSSSDDGIVGGGHNDANSSPPSHRQQHINDLFPSRDNNDSNLINDYQHQNNNNNWNQMNDNNTCNLDQTNMSSLSHFSTATKQQQQPNVHHQTGSNSEEIREELMKLQSQINEHEGIRNSMKTIARAIGENRKKNHNKPENNNSNNNLVALCAKLLPELASVHKDALSALATALRSAAEKTQTAIDHNKEEQTLLIQKATASAIGDSSSSPTTRNKNIARRRQQNSGRSGNSRQVSKEEQLRKRNAQKKLLSESVYLQQNHQYSAANGLSSTSLFTAGDGSHSQSTSVVASPTSATIIHSHKRTQSHQTSSSGGAGRDGSTVSPTLQQNYNPHNFMQEFSVSSTLNNNNNQQNQLGTSFGGAPLAVSYSESHQHTHDADGATALISSSDDDDDDNVINSNEKTQKNANSNQQQTTSTMMINLPMVIRCKYTSPKTFFNSLLDDQSISSLGCINKNNLLRLVARVELELAICNAREHSSSTRATLISEKQLVSSFFDATSGGRRTSTTSNPPPPFVAAVASGQSSFRKQRRSSVTIQAHDDSDHDADQQKEFLPPALVSRDMMTMGMTNSTKDELSTSAFPRSASYGTAIGGTSLRSNENNLDENEQTMISSSSSSAFVNRSPEHHSQQQQPQPLRPPPLLATEGSFDPPDDEALDDTKNNTVTTISEEGTSAALTPLFGPEINNNNSSSNNNNFNINKPPTPTSNMNNNNRQRFNSFGTAVGTDDGKESSHHSSQRGASGMMNANNNNNDNQNSIPVCPPSSFLLKFAAAASLLHGCELTQFFTGDFDVLGPVAKKVSPDDDSLEGRLRNSQRNKNNNNNNKKSGTTAGSPSSNSKNRKRSTSGIFGSAASSPSKQALTASIRRRSSSATITSAAVSPISFSSSAGASPRARSLSQSFSKNNNYNYESNNKKNDHNDNDENTNNHGSSPTSSSIMKGNNSSIRRNTKIMMNLSATVKSEDDLRKEEAVKKVMAALGRAFKSARNKQKTPEELRRERNARLFDQNEDPDQKCPFAVSPSEGNLLQRIDWLIQLCEAHPNGYLVVSSATAGEALSRFLLVASLTWQLPGGEMLCPEPLERLRLRSAVLCIEKWWVKLQAALEEKRKNGSFRKMMNDNKDAPVGGSSLKSPKSPTSIMKKNVTLIYDDQQKNNNNSSTTSNPILGSKSESPTAEKTATASSSQSSKKKGSSIFVSHPPPQQQERKSTSRPSSAAHQRPSSAIPSLRPDSALSASGHSKSILASSANNINNNNNSTTTPVLQQQKRVSIAPTAPTTTATTTTASKDIEKKDSFIAMAKLSSRSVQAPFITRKIANSTMNKRPTAVLAEKKTDDYNTDDDDDEAAYIRQHTHSAFVRKPSWTSKNVPQRPFSASLKARKEMEEQQLEKEEKEKEEELQTIDADHAESRNHNYPSGDTETNENALLSDDEDAFNDPGQAIPFEPERDEITFSEEDEKKRSSTNNKKVTADIPTLKEDSSMIDEMMVEEDEEQQETKKEESAIVGAAADLQETESVTHQHEQKDNINNNFVDNSTAQNEAAPPSKVKDSSSSSEKDSLRKIGMRSLNPAIRNAYSHQQNHSDSEMKNSSSRQKQILFTHDPAASSLSSSARIPRPPSSSLNTSAASAAIIKPININITGDTDATVEGSVLLGADKLQQQRENSAVLTALEQRKRKEQQHHLFFLKKNKPSEQKLPCRPLSARTAAASPLSSRSQFSQYHNRPSSAMQIQDIATITTSSAAQQQTNQQQQQQQQQKLASFDEVPNSAHAFRVACLRESAEAKKRSDTKRENETQKKLDLIKKQNEQDEKERKEKYLEARASSSSRKKLPYPLGNAAPLMPFSRLIPHSAPTSPRK